MPEQNDADRLGLAPRKEKLDAAFGPAVSTSDEPVNLNIPDAPAPRTALVSDQPITLESLTMADIGTKITTIDQLNQLLRGGQGEPAVKPHVPPARTERQQQQLNEEMEAGRRRVEFYREQAVINPKPVDPREVQVNRPMFQSDDGVGTKERDAKRF